MLQRECAIEWAALWTGIDLEPGYKSVGPKGQRKRYPQNAGNLNGNNESITFFNW